MHLLVGGACVTQCGRAVRGRAEQRCRLLDGEPSFIGLIGNIRTVDEYTDAHLSLS